MARQGFRSRGSMAPKRQIANDGLSQFSGTQITFGVANQITAANNGGFGIVVPAATLVRTRGCLRVSVVTSGIAGGRIMGAMGMIVVSTEAFTVGGLGSLPTPLDDIENDWFVYQPFCLHTDATDPSANDVYSDFLVNFDSRGQRKLKTGDLLAIVYEAAQSHSTTGTVLDATVMFRSQFKL